MDKTSLMVILNECFEKEGNSAYLHFVDGSNLFINSLPSFFESHVRVISKYEINGKIISETVCIPYGVVMYITLTNSDNLKIIREQYPVEG